jgi:hypothetical protein
MVAFNLNYRMRVAHGFCVHSMRVSMSASHNNSEMQAYLVAFERKYRKLCHVIPISENPPQVWLVDIGFWR